MFSLFRLAQDVLRRYINWGHMRKRQPRLFKKTTGELCLSPSVGLDTHKKHKGGFVLWSLGQSILRKISVWCTERTLGLGHIWNQSTHLLDHNTSRHSLCPLAKYITTVKEPITAFIYIEFFSVTPAPHFSLHMIELWKCINIIHLKGMFDAFIKRDMDDIIFGPGGEQLRGCS